MSAFNTPFQRGQGLSNQGIPSPSQFRPTPDSAVADAVSRAGVSIAQQAIRNQREEERQKQLEEQQEQRLAVRRATAEAQEAKAALGRQLSEGQITHDQYFAESSSLLDNTKGAFEDLAKTYPDAQAVMDIASLEVANSLNNTTSGIRVKYLEDQAYQNAAEDIEQLSEGMQVFRPDPQTGENIFFIEPTVERLAMIRSQIDADTALSARDKATLIARLEHETVFTAINKLKASGKMTPEAMSEIARMTDNDVLKGSIDKIRDEILETQDADKKARDTRDYNLLEQSEFSAFQQAPTPDLVTMFNNLTSSLSGLDVDVSQEDIVQKTLRAAETRLASGEFVDVVGQGGTLSSEQVNELATMEAQVDALLEATGYTDTKDGITLLNQIKSIRKQNVKNKNDGQSLASTAPITDIFNPDDPGRAAAIKASIDDGTYLARMVGNYNELGYTEPEYINHIESLADKGNYKAVSRFASQLTPERRAEFASSQGLSGVTGIVVRLATRMADGGSNAQQIQQVLDNPLALERAVVAIGEVNGRIVAATADADYAARYELSTTSDADVARDTSKVTEALRFGQRFDRNVLGALSFEDIEGNQVGLTLAGFEVVEPYFVEQIGIQTALVSGENPGMGRESVSRIAYARARDATQKRYTFVTQKVARFKNDGTTERQEVLIPYDNTLLPSGVGVKQLLTQADKAINDTNEWFDDNLRMAVDEKDAGLAAKLDLQNLHLLKLNGEQKYIVPYVSMVDNRTVGYFTIDKEDLGQVEPRGYFGGGGDPIQGTNLKMDQYQDLIDQGWQESSLSPGEPTAMLGDSYDPTLLWNPELYDSPSVKLLHPVAQAKLMRHAQLVAGKTFPEASDATKMTIAMQMISDHGWKLS